MAKGDVTIRFSSNESAPNPGIRALMHDYNANSADRLDAVNQGNRFMHESLAVNKAASAIGAAGLHVEGNLGQALISAYDQKLHTVEITHTTEVSILGSTQEVLYKGAITPDLANRLEQAVNRIGNNLKTLDVSCKNERLTSSQCEEFKQTLPASIINEALGNTR